MLRALLVALILWLSVRDGLAAERVADAPIELSLLSYNVHGLPSWISRDAPALRMPLIAERMNAYDVVLVQEDWVYHRLLREKTTHETVAHGSGARSFLLAGFGPFCGACGSGLTVLAREPESALLDVEREAFGRCSGWFADGNDCIASKGFLMLRLRLANGAELDVWNVHLDAGRSDADQAARLAQLELLRERIARLSAGRALILGGDFNLGFERPREREALRTLEAALSLEDSAARPPAGGRWRERIDYILFRSAGDVSLELLEAGTAEEFVHEGRALSDHPAIRARFRVRHDAVAEAARAARR